MMASTGSTLSDTGTNNTFNNISSKSEIDAITDVLFQVETYYLWVILALGFPGNCATIVTVIKMSPARSLTVYIAILAVVDNLAIISKLLIFVLLDNRVQIGDIGCKILGFLGNFLITFGNWLLVAMSIERFAAVWFPLKVGRIWTFKKSLIAVLMLSLPLCALFLHLFWIMKIVDEEDTGILFCDIHDRYRYFMMHIWFWINIVVYAAIPCVLLLFFNVLIVIGIVKSGKLRKYLNSSQGRDTRNTSDRNRPVTIMLVTAAISLVVLTTPRCVMLILIPYWSPLDGSQEEAAHDIIDTLAYILCDSTHAINFYVYSMSSKRFRSHFIDLIFCRNDIKACGSNYASLTGRSSVKSSVKFNMASFSKLTGSPERSERTKA